MDYQYINTVLRGVYKNLPMPNPFPKGMEDELRKYAGIMEAEGFAENRNYAMFSLVKDCPPTVVLSRKSLKQFSTSVCYDTQAMGWHLDGETMRTGLTQKLFTPFLSEQEIREYDQTGERIIGTESVAPLTEPQMVSSEAIRAILYGAFNRWSRGSAPIQIVVPEGVDYNSYVFWAVDTVYSYFPVGLRAEAGFSSCLFSGNATEMNRLMLLFIPESRKTGSAVALDGSTPAACQSFIASTGFPGLNKLIDHLAALADGEKRAKLLNDIYESLEQGSGFLELQPYDYAIFGDSLDILDDSRDEAQLIPVWQRFCQDTSHYPAKLRQSMLSSISERVTGAGLCAAAQTLLDAGKTPEETAAYFQGIVTAAPRVGIELWTLLSAQITGGSAQEYARVSGNEQLWIALAGEEPVGEYLTQRAKDCVRALAAEEKQILTRDAQAGKLNLALFQTRLALFQEKTAAYPEAGMDEALRQELHVFAYSLERQKHSANPCLTYEPLSTNPGQARKNLALLQELKQNLAAWNCHDEFMANLDSRMELHRACLQSNEAQLNEVLGQMEQSADYFQKLELLGERAGDFDQYGSDRLAQRAAAARPASYGSYLSAYERRYRTRLLLGKLSCPDFVKGRVLSDLAQLLPENVNLHPEGKSPMAMRDFITEMQKQAQLFGLKAPKIYMNGSCYEADFLKYILTCDAAALQNSCAEAQRVSQTVSLLLEQGVYTPAMFDGVYRLFREYGINTVPLMNAVMNGQFDDDENSFMEFFSQYVGSSSIRTLKKKWNAKNGKAWNDLMAYNKRRKDKGPFFKPFLVTLLVSLLLAAGLTVSLVALFKEPSEDVIPVTTEEYRFEIPTEPTAPIVDFIVDPTVEAETTEETGTAEITETTEETIPAMTEIGFLVLTDPKPMPTLPTVPAETVTEPTTEPTVPEMETEPTESTVPDPISIAVG